MRRTTLRKSLRVVLSLWIASFFLTSFSLAQENALASDSKVFSFTVQTSSVVRSENPIVITLTAFQQAHLTIRIFNLSGGLIGDWSEEIAPGGEKEWSWNGQNMYGEQVNNGLYIWRVTAKGADGTQETVTKVLGVIR
jgi:flagellar hook assembly protein FlgD